MGKFRPNSRDNMPFFIGGAVILLIMVLYFVVTPGDAPNPAIQEMENKLLYMGQRITVLERQNTEMRGYIDSVNMKMGDFNGRYNSLKTVPEEIERTSERMKHLETRQGNLEKRMGALAKSRARSGRASSGTVRKTIVPAAQKPDPAQRAAAVVKPAPAPKTAPKSAPVPRPAFQPAPKPAAPAAAAVSGGGSHMVQDGETMYSIARAYGLTVSELRALNGLSEEAVIHPGQSLTVRR